LKTKFASNFEMQPSRPLLHSLGLILATVAAGLAMRFAHLGLPAPLVKYGGSMLWALMIYWIVSSLLPSRRFLAAALIAGTLATAVEFLKLYHAPALDAFRLTLPGILLLGRIFSAWDIAAYCLAISIGAWLDRTIRPEKRQSCQ
jgi:hypothetical protein